MEKQMYRLLGTVSVPECKKAELNEYVLEVLYKGGIRKTCEVVLDGKIYTVIKPAVPDENGIVQFDYSIFERKLRQVGSYDTNNCTLEVCARGNNEYAFIMNTLMFLQEIYSENMCLLMSENIPHPYPDGYLRFLKGMLGIELYNDKRNRMWDMSYFLYRNGITDVKPRDLLDGTATADIFSCPEQTEAYFESVFLEKHLDDKGMDIPKNKIASAKPAERRSLLLKLFRDKLSVNDDKFETELKVLLNSELRERQKISERNDAIGIIAMCSLYMLPATIVGAYAGIKKIAFWDAWEAFGEHKYTDFFPAKEVSETERSEQKVLPFYKVIQRKDENEFLEYWDGDNLILTDEMKEYIEDWLRWYEEVDSSLDVQMEKELALIAEAVCSQWKPAYLDYDFVTEFLNNKENDNYRKAIKLFRMTKEKDCRLFPELTVKQAYEWMVSPNQSAEDRIAIRAYQSLLNNKEQRLKLFGF